MSIDITNPGQHTRRTRVRTVRALTVAAAGVAALAGWLLAGPVAGVELTVHSGVQVQRVGPGAVVLSSLVAAAAAWALLALLERLTSRSRGVFTVVAGAVLLLSLTGPFTAATSTASAVVLAGLHLLVAAVLVPGLITARGSRRSTGITQPA